MTKYVKNKEIRVEKLPNGLYIYNDDDVYRKAGIKGERMNAIYSRVSTPKQKEDLKRQEQLLIQFCNSNGIKIGKAYSDIASGMNFDRKNFRLLLDDIINHRIGKLYITYKDRLSRISYDLFEKLFEEFGCRIVVVNEMEDKSDEKEIFEEIISMLHCFSMKMYSKRRKKKLQLVREDLKNALALETED